MREDAFANASGNATTSRLPCGSSSANAAIRSPLRVLSERTAPMMPPTVTSNARGAGGPPSCAPVVGSRQLGDAAARRSPGAPAGTARSGARSSRVPAIPSRRPAAAPRSTPGRRAARRRAPLRRPSCRRTPANSCVWPWSRSRRLRLPCSSAFSTAANSRERSAGAGRPAERRDACRQGIERAGLHEALEDAPVDLLASRAARRAGTATAPRRRAAGRRAAPARRPRRRSSRRRGRTARRPASR